MARHIAFLAGLGSNEALCYAEDFLNSIKTLFNLILFRIVAKLACNTVSALGFFVARVVSRGNIIIATVYAMFPTAKFARMHLTFFFNRHAKTS
ncbi:MAG: hypothetical protein ACI4UU_00865 [Clostridia bacterium]